MLQTKNLHQACVKIQTFELCKNNLSIASFFQMHFHSHYQIVFDLHQRLEIIFYMKFFFIWNDRNSWAVSITSKTQPDSSIFKYFIISSLFLETNELFFGILKKRSPIHESRQIGQIMGNLSAINDIRLLERQWSDQSDWRPPPRQLPSDPHDRVQ